MIRKCAIYYRAISNEDRNYEFEISNIKQISSRDIKRFLYPVIRSNERFVLDDAIEIVTNKFDKYFIPNENELLFLENFIIYPPSLINYLELDYLLYPFTDINIYAINII